MKSLVLQVYLFAILGQQRHEFVNYGPSGQIIVSRSAINLLALPLDPAEFFMERPGLISKPLSASRATLIELRVVHPRSSTIPGFIIRVPGAITPISW
jgi:hypothetical protein